MENITKEKLCAFYASDYHFEMIGLPYINKSMEENKEIVILTENNLDNTIHTLVSKINLNDKKKKKILNLDWNNNDLKKFKKISECSKNGTNMVIFIKGKENYIKNINKNIEKWTEGKENISIINCYEFFEVKDKMENIIKEHTKVLGTLEK